MGAVVVRKIRDGTSKSILSKKNVRLPFLPPSRPPRRRASKVRRCCTFCQRSATAAPARTPAPVPFLWDPRTARSFAFAHAASEGDRGLASQQRSRSCTASANQLQLQCTAKTPLAGSPPDPCATPRSHGPCVAPPSGAAASPRSELRPALHTARARPPRDTRTPHLRRPCPRAAPYPNIAPGRMGRDWPMADQSAVRRTADAQRGNTAQPRRAVRGGRQHPSRADREGHTGGREVRRGLAW